MDKVTVLFPGGFKPITGAHMALAQRYAQNPNVNKVLMFIGPKARHGVTRDQSKQIFNLLNRNKKIQLIYSRLNSPIASAFDYLLTMPEDTVGKFALAAANKDKDYVRIKDFIGAVDKYKINPDKKGNKIPQGVDAIELMVNVDPLTYPNGEPISADSTISTINSGELSKFKDSYPNYSDAIVKNIWQLLGGESTFGDEFGDEAKSRVQKSAGIKPKEDFSTQMPLIGWEYDKFVENYKNLHPDNVVEDGPDNYTYGYRKGDTQAHWKYDDLDNVIQSDSNKEIRKVIGSPQTATLWKESKYGNQVSWNTSPIQTASGQMPKEKHTDGKGNELPTKDEYEIGDKVEIPYQYMVTTGIVRSIDKRGKSNPRNWEYTVQQKGDEAGTKEEDGYNGPRSYPWGYDIYGYWPDKEKNESILTKDWWVNELLADAKQMFNELRTGKRLRVFDFDDTLSKMNATIYVTHRDGNKTNLSPAEFAVYEPRPGDDFDFRDFDKIIKGATPISVNIEALRKAQNDPGAKTTILTARGIGYPVKRYLEREHGIKNVYVVALGSSDPMDKARWIEDQIKKGYDDIYFIDDSHKNIAAVKTLIDKYPDVHMDVELAEGYETPKGAKAHIKKISKLRKYLDKDDNKGFVYDFDKFPKTVFGTKHLTEGGLAGHMNHPFERATSRSLTFGDMKEIVARALQGRLDIESVVTEKTDGLNIFVTVKDGQVKFARNKGERVNPLTAKELATKFAGRGDLTKAFTETGEDLASAFSQVNSETIQSIFQNGRVFANMEIIYPDTKNVISYDIAALQFHNLQEFDEKGNVVQTDMTGANVIQKAVEDANAHMQKTFNLIPPNKIKVGQLEDFEDYQDALFNELDQLKNQYELDDKDTISEYHKGWWRDVIQDKATELGYEIPEEVLELLVDRWAFNLKGTRITAVKKMIDNEKFANWVTDFDKKDFKQYQKQNVEPFESVFLKLGAEVLKNVSSMLAANPNKTAQQIRKDLASVIRELRATNDLRKLELMKTHLQKIQRMGGFEKIVPIEGLVFVYGGNTYKLTGSFAPINQILNIVKYSR